jgi:uncharacterized membrane protein YhaH (DUF805 family)
LCKIVSIPGIFIYLRKCRLSAPYTEEIGMDLLFGFSGRIGRLQWWLAQLVMAIVLGLTVGMVIGIVATDDLARSTAALDHLDGRAASVLLVIAAAVVVLVWINVASTVKRFHDRNKSGFWFFITFVPYIGALWQIVECGFLPGSPGSNNYGPPPGSDDRSLYEVFAEESRLDQPAADPQPRLARARRPVDAPASPYAARTSVPTGFGRRGRS